MLEEARAVDAEEDARFDPDRRGDELPEGQGRHVEQLRRLQEAKARLEREATEVAQATQEHLAQRASAVGLEQGPLELSRAVGLHQN